MAPVWTEKTDGLFLKWWTEGTVVDADVAAIYQALGNRDFDTSVINRANPGTNDIPKIGIVPSLATATGWTFNGTTQVLKATVIPDSDYTIIVRFGTPNGSDGIVGARIAGSDFSLETIMATPFNGVLRTRWGNGVQDTGALFTGQNIHVIALAGQTPYFDGVAQTAVVGVWGGGPIAIWFGAHNSGGAASDFFANETHAIVIYNRTLTAAEVSAITINMQALTAADTFEALFVNFIAQKATSKHLGLSSHHLWIATDGGVFETLNGGSAWAQITLPDPSNAEFGDSPVATVEDLKFDWVAFDPGDESIVYVRGITTTPPRAWIYKTTDNGLAWISRGVTI